MKTMNIISVVLIHNFPVLYTRTKAVGPYHIDCKPFAISPAVQPGLVLGLVIGLVATAVCGLLIPVFIQ